MKTIRSQRPEIKLEIIVEKHKQEIDEFFETTEKHSCALQIERQFPWKSDHFPNYREKYFLVRRLGKFVEHDITDSNLALNPGVLSAFSAIFGSFIPNGEPFSFDMVYERFLSRFPKNKMSFRKHISKAVFYLDNRYAEVLFNFEKRFVIIRIFRDQRLICPCDIAKLIQAPAT